MKNHTRKSLKAMYFLTWPLTAALLHNSRRVRIVVLAEDHILLQRSSFGSQTWSLPGGGIDKGENPFAAAVRELEEETGVVVRQSQLRCIGEDRLPKNKRWPQSDILFYVVTLPKMVPATVTRPLEILEAKWYRLSRMPEAHSSTIEIALKMLKA